MASLPSPGNCTGCGSDFLLREHHPERWVCQDCGIVVVSRGTKPETGVCRECGAKKADGIPFSKHSNICLTCKGKYNKQYGIDNKEKLAYQHRESYQRDKEKRRAAVIRSIQRSPEAFISHLVCGLCRPSNWRKKRGILLSAHRLAILNHVLITTTDMIQLYYNQGGLCVLTGLKMEHYRKNLRSISIDRIDSNIGYIPGNVQLVCQFANKAKGIHSNEEVLAVFEAIRKQDRRESNGSGTDSSVRATIIRGPGEDCADVP